MHAPWIVLLVALAACGRISFDPLGGGGGGDDVVDDGRTNGDGAPADCPVVGNVCADGTIFGGISPDGGKPMFVEPTTNYGGPWSFGSGSAPAQEVQTSMFDTTTGAANTAALSIGGTWQDADAGTAGIQPHEAANYCTDLTSQGHSDWYLPARDELRVLYAGRLAIGGFPDDEYWASNEETSCPMSCATVIDFPSGAESPFRNKYDYRAARCVRR